MWCASADKDDPCSPVFYSRVTFSFDQTTWTEAQIKVLVRA
jgi:hypothetical protein